MLTLSLRVPPDARQKLVVLLTEAIWAPAEEPRDRFLGDIGEV
jgi:hypothetical protein